MKKYIIGTSTAKDLTNFMELWGMLGPSRWEVVSAIVRRTNEGFQVEISSEDACAEDVLDDDVFGKKGFLTLEGWNAEIATV